LSGIPIDTGAVDFTALVEDVIAAFDERRFTVVILPPFLCGDSDGNETISVADAVYIINYVFSGGPAPYPIESGDANADGDVTVADAAYLINHIFKGGPEPQCP
jgi:hypothetical protein